MKDSLDGLNTRFQMASKSVNRWSDKQKLSNFKNRNLKIRINKSKQSFWDTENTVKQANLCVISVPKNKTVIVGKCLKISWQRTSQNVF